MGGRARPALPPEEEEDCPGDDDEGAVVPAMIWSLEEAEMLEEVQTGASSCGATAIITVLRALGVEVPPGAVEACVRTNQRRNQAHLPDYLLSRSVAGATHQQLLTGVSEATEGRVIGRFFPLYPVREVRLRSWLAGWIRRGAVPVATMNLQVAPPEGEEVPDAWHHQMIFGVDTAGIYLTNPIQVEESELVRRRLCSESVLLVRREDILTRLTGGTELSHLNHDQRWKVLNVAGQVKQMIYEMSLGDVALTPWVTIPAAYQSGISLFTLSNSQTATDLLTANELPLKQ
ncbi:uncharacterized protein LOC121850380 [Callorhinchus milii]|uniref:uncharacterized protein LOC121850380 n=1 Tax=Callorhinchus milii TaxID=7868 RepID=UPI001C3F5BD4|nr:uncharacterized protein LOC121850380 [Callorhinchus milii]